MKKTLLFLSVASTLFGAGYQIADVSLNSMALGNANIANAHGADTSYYNPANMSKLKDKRNNIELSLSYIRLGKIKYKQDGSTSTIRSKLHTAILPHLHFVSKPLNDKGVRVGFSVVTPAGLCRQWEDQPAAATAKKFSLTTVELNPTISFAVNEKLSVGVGFRYMYAKGEVQIEQPGLYSVDIKGDDGASYGYNVALSYQMNEKLNISATYRSKINLHIEGDADAVLLGLPISSEVALDVLVPANFAVAAAYKLSSDLTVEFVYDRTMWSAMQDLDFDYSDATLEAVFGGASQREWDDSQSYRFGITKEFDKYRLMGGISYNTSPVPSKYVSFSSPESASMTYAVGGRYKIDENFNVGMAVLYSKNKKISVHNATVNGTLSGKDVFVLSTGIEYRF